MSKTVNNDGIQRVGNEREVKQSVPRTAVHQIAEACAAKIYSEGHYLTSVKSLGPCLIDVKILDKTEAGELLAKTLDAIHASSQE
jgi:hypothetical protein